jgi:hypothetical protein
MSTTTALCDTVVFMTKDVWTLLGGIAFMMLAGAFLISASSWIPPLLQWASSPGLQGRPFFYQV